MPYYYFLSASVPYGERALTYKPDPIAVRDAVRALVATVIRDSVLVFGGHPAITPLIWDAISSIGRDGEASGEKSRSAQNNGWDYRKPNRFHQNAIIYQSSFFEDAFPKEARYFGNSMILIDKRETPEESLAVMRRKMIGEYAYSAGFFIGGMNGCDEEEWPLFQDMQPGIPTFPIASTEGAARLLWEKCKEKFPESVWKKLANELRYQTLFRELLGINR